MHDGRWGHGWGMGNGWWMAIAMIAFVAAVAWVIVMLVRRGNQVPPERPATGGPVAASGQMPQEVLAERLARGEIEPEEYSARLAALLGPPQS